MGEERIKSIISALNRFELTELEKQFISSVEKHFKQNGTLTDQQASILEGIFREKTRGMRNAIHSKEGLPEKSIKKAG